MSETMVLSQTPAMLKLRKMQVEHTECVLYTLMDEDQALDINALIGRQLQIKFNGVINCVACGVKTNKSFNQGHCYNCFSTLAQCDQCIVKPQLCHYAAGTCREPG